MLKIRLARGGSTHKPFYFIVVANSKSARDSGYLEKIGYYNPLLEQGETRGNHIKFSVDEQRLAYWYGVGAQPTDKVVSICNKNNLQIFKSLTKKITEHEFTGKSRKDVKKVLADRKAEMDKKAKEKAAAKKAVEAAAQ
jgi:small subunit ribosomal protein S16